MVDAVVLYDEHLPSSWIHKETWSSKIRDQLRAEGFGVKDALNTAEWVRATLDRGTAGSGVLVFSQDIVPANLTQSSPGGLLRRFLDAGGRVVWIGDIPAWSQSFPKRWTGEGESRKEIDREEVAQSGLHYATIPVQPLVAESSELCEWVPKWRPRMKSRWHSERPINLEDAPRLPRSEAHWPNVEPLAFARVTLLPNGWNALVITRWKKSGTRRTSWGINAGVPILGGSVNFSEGFPHELSLEGMRLASAWHIRYNPDYPEQGFYRLWDAGGPEGDGPPQSLLEDILTAARAK